MSISLLKWRNSSWLLEILLMNMCEGILGCFKLTESENFEEYLEALEIPQSIRKMMAGATPKVRNI